MMNNNELIQQARELCEKATPGPWVSLHGIPNPSVCQDRDWDKEIAAVHGSNDYGGYQYHQAVADADLMAASSTLIPQLCDALEAMTARAEQAEAENRWIPVGDRLPDKIGRYLTTHVSTTYKGNKPQKKVSELDWVGDECGWLINGLHQVTHWRPLPAPPKGV